MLKNSTGKKLILCRQTFTETFCEVSHVSLADVSAGYCYRSVVDGSGIIRSQSLSRGRTIAQNGRIAWGTLCGTTP
jgi:hypothetical protein